MEGNKLEIAGRVAADPPPATYKQISESDVEGAIQSRPKSLTKSQKSIAEMDGADEKMLPSVEKNLTTDSKIDAGDVKFTTNEKQNGEAKLDICEIKSAFVGMGKEELMKYANDPFWVRLRWCLFIAFWLLWLGMLVGAIVIIIAAPKCNPPAPRTWWEQGPLVEVEPTIPDDKLTEIIARKFKGVIITNPGDSYRPVNDSVAVLNFLKRANAHDLNVIIELEPTTSSIWLDKSEQKEEPFTDYYIWAKPKSPDNGTGSPVPPTNWLSPYTSASAWKYSKPRELFYYSPGESPHLNFRNPVVVEEFGAIVRQWLDAGVKGVRLRGAPFLLIDDKLEDESISPTPGYVHTQYNFYTHVRTLNVEGIGEVLRQWQDIIKEKNNGPLMVVEDLNALDSYIVNDTLSIDLPRHTKLFYMADKLSNATQIYQGLQSAFSVLGDFWPLWEYDSNNFTLPLSPDVLNIVTMLLPGSPLISEGVQIESELLKIREVPSVMFGSCHRQLLANNTVFAYLRVAAGNPGYLVACNPSEKDVSVDFTVMRNVSDEITIQVLSNGYSVPEMLPNLKIPANAVKMPAKSAIVLTYVPKTS